MDSEGNNTSTVAARSQLLAVELEFKQIVLAKQRGLLIPIDKVIQNLASLVLQLKSRILSVPSRLAAEVIGEKEATVVQAKIERALVEALSPLSQSDLSL